MAGMALKMVSKYFESKETNANEVRDDVLMIGWEIKVGKILIFFHFDESDTHVHLEGRNFITVPQDKFDSMYKVINECNDKFTHVKFVLDTESGEICARDDDFIQLDSCGPECFNLMVAMLSIVEEAYPMLMKAMWG